MILFLTVLALHCCAWAFSSCGEQGLLSSCCAWASHCGGFSCCGAWAPGGVGSVFVACGFSCSVACGIFLDQGSNPCPLRWQADSYSAYHQGSPYPSFLIIAIPTIMKWYFVLVLTCLSMILSDINHLFTCLLALCVSSSATVKKLY